MQRVRPSRAVAQDEITLCDCLVDVWRHNSNVDAGIYTRDRKLRAHGVRTN